MVDRATVEAIVVFTSLMLHTKGTRSGLRGMVILLNQPV